MAHVFKVTFDPYPGKLAAVVHCQGCAWRCGHCFNPELQPARGEQQVAWPEVLAFLGRRTGLLDAVVFSGGEPTQQRGLEAAMREVKAMGFLVGLHTAGIVPWRLAKVLPLVDWVAMDVKAEFCEHEAVTRVRGSGERARQSRDLIMKSGVACELHAIAAGKPSPPATATMAGRAAGDSRNREFPRSGRQPGGT